MMKKNYFKLKAQSTLEYSLIFACLAAACIAMRGYVERSVQGGLRQACDQIGGQYSGDNTHSSITLNFDSDMKMKSEIIQAFDPVTKVLLEDQYQEPIYAMENKTVSPVDEKTTKRGYENLGDFEANLF